MELKLNDADVYNAYLYFEEGDIVNALVRLGLVVFDAGATIYAAKITKKGALKFVDDIADQLDDVTDPALDPAAKKKIAKYADDVEAGNFGNVISPADRAKISKWKYPPKDDLYLKYKKVFDNPNYFNQVTGEIIWPPNNGFSNTPVQEVLQPGKRIDRYGFDTGYFVSPEGIQYEMRAVAPGTYNRPYSVFEVVEPITVESGGILPWFDEPGGGIQYNLPDTIEELLKAKKIKLIRRIEP